jgi:hypothetical protein
LRQLFTVGVPPPEFLERGARDRAVAVLPRSQLQFARAQIKLERSEAQGHGWLGLKGHGGSSPIIGDEFSTASKQEGSKNETTRQRIEKTGGAMRKNQG